MPGLSQNASPSSREKSGKPAQTMFPSTIKRLNEAELVDSKFIIDGKEIKQVDMKISFSILFGFSPSLLTSLLCTISYLSIFSLFYIV